MLSGSKFDCPTPHTPYSDCCVLILRTNYIATCLVSSPQFIKSHFIHNSPHIDNIYAYLSNAKTIIISTDSWTMVARLVISRLNYSLIPHSFVQCIQSPSNYNNWHHSYHSNVYTTYMNHLCFQSMKLTTEYIRTTYEWLQVKSYGFSGQLVLQRCRRQRFFFIISFMCVFVTVYTDPSTVVRS